MCDTLIVAMLFDNRREVKKMIMTSGATVLMRAAALSGAAAAADPEPFTKAALVSVAVTTLVAAVVGEAVHRTFRKLFD